ESWLAYVRGVPGGLGAGAEHAAAGGAEGEAAVHAVRGEEVDVGADGLLVRRGAPAREGSQRGGDRSVQHRPSLSSCVVANLRVERDGPVLRVTLARPDRRNAFDAQLIGELAEAFVDVGRTRAVVLAGEGASFCAGADVDWMRSSVGLSFDQNVADANAMRRMF